MHSQIADILEPTPLIAMQLQTERVMAEIQDQVLNVLLWAEGAIRHGIIAATAPSASSMSTIMGGLRLVVTHNDLGTVRVASQEIATDRVLACVEIDEDHPGQEVGARLVQMAQPRTRIHG